VSPWGWTLRLLLWPLFLLGSLLLVAWLVLHWAILPHIEQWRPQIEMRASALLGVPVTIGAIEVRSSGWVPAIELRDVVLLDPEKRPALSLPRVSTALSPRSLLALEPRFEQLLVEGAHLEVRRNADGRIFVAGLDLSGPGGGDTDAADWVVKQHEIVIRGGSLRWTDERRNASPLELSDVQLVMRNGLRRHDIRLDATPPPEWGDRFSVQGRFTQSLLARAGDWSHWSGNVYAELPRADLRELRRHVSLPFELSEGVGALRAWLELRDGQPRVGTADVALRAVSLRLAANVAPLTLEQLEGRLVGQRTDQGLTLSLQRFGFLSGNGLRWPSGELNLSLRQRPGEPSTGGKFNAERLDLGLLAEVAASLPLGDALRRLLAEVKPQGVLGDLALQWDGPLDAPTRYQVKGALSGLSLASHAAAKVDAVGRPGLRNASVQLQADQDGGTAQINVIGGAVELPGVFEDPLLPLDRLSAQVLWKIDGARVAVEVKDARFANRDAQGELSARWQTGAGASGTFARGGRLPGQIELNGKLGKAVATRTARYLPLGIPESTRRYVEHAVKGGTLSSVAFRVKGDLWDFPFRAAASKGEFRIAAQVEGATFAYVPSTPATAREPAHESPWPALTRVSGELVLDRSALQIRNAQAQLGGMQWSRLQGDIPNLAEQPVLTLDGQAQGPLSEMLRLVNATPIGGWIGKALAQSTGAGAADLRLALAIPLTDVAATDVKGSLLLAGNDVRITPDSPLLAGARGQVDFDRRGFAVVGATARAYGGEIAFEGGTQPNANAGDAGIRFTGQGSTTAEALRRAPELGLVSRLAGYMKGQAAYRLELGFMKGHPEVMISSDLVGMVSDLPAPLRKAAEAPLALRYQTRLARDSLAPGQPLRDTLRVDLGNLLQAQYQRDLSSPLTRVLRGGVGVGEPAPTPAAGVTVAINLPNLNVDVWQGVYDKLFDDPRPVAVAAPAAAEAVVQGDPVESPGYGPGTLTVRAQDMLFLSRRLSKVVAGITQDRAQWRVNIEADQLAGYVEYRPPQRGVAPGPTTSGRVFARLARLSLPRSEVDQVENLLEEQPSTAPSLDIVIDDFELRGKRLGRLEIEAANRVYSEGRDALREWRLAKFNLLTPEAQLTASGHWALGVAGSTGRRAVMDFKLALADSGAYLERLGMGKVVRGGKGQISGQLAWQGSPLTIDYASLSGQAHVEVEAGQFLKVDPGAARLLGVLSLQSLPRRLALDFRDLFDEGFPFDSFAGDMKIAQGVAHTNNLRMRGVQAAVLMEGQADLARETQDLRVVVVPEINAGTASLAYAIINPAVGLGTFLAQMFLRRPFMQANTREFHVTGPWADPKVDRVERAADAAMPDLDPPEPAASEPRPGQ
jgi:uncharacterized protein (TIGR02099 family)